MRPAVFLDRDDTLIDTSAATASSPHPGDVTTPDQVRLRPHATDALPRLVDAGFVLVAVSNQGAVARNHASLQAVHAANARLFELLPAPGRPPNDAPEPPARPHVSLPSSPSLLAAIYFCPYHPNGTIPEFTREHPWRKPAPGMITTAAADLGLDLSRSWLIGDAERDVAAGIAAGLDPARCLRIGPGAPHADVDHAARTILHGSAIDA